MTPSVRRVLVAFACLGGPLVLPSYAQFPHCAGPSPDVEPNDTPATASPINRSPSAPSHVVPSNGAIDPAGDVDHFRIDLLAGQRLWVLVDTAVSAIGSRDSYVRVLAPDGSVLAENDNDGTAFDLQSWTVLSQDAAAIAGVEAPTSGTYVIRVSAANPADRMSYRMWTAVSSGASVAEIEPNDTSPVQPTGDETVLAQIGPGDVDVFWGGVLGNGPRMVLADGAVDFAAPTDLTLTLVFFSSLPVDSSGIGGAEAVMVPEGGSLVRITAPSSLSGVRPYRYALFHVGDSYNLPVSLQSFSVE